MENSTIMFLPQIFPESADPEGSIRYSCFIINKKQKNEKESINFIDNIEKDNCFIIEENTKSLSDNIMWLCGKGIVIKEKDNKYSWFFT